MAKTKVLIAVKTYPTLSNKYSELVCTAGFREDGSWIRIYPIPFRKLGKYKQYKKWQWIELDLIKNDSDFRPESYRLSNIDSEITLLNTIPTDNYWEGRKKFALNNVWYNMKELINSSRINSFTTSLAVLKPKEIIDFIWEKEKEREWSKEKIDNIIAMQSQLSLFEEENNKKNFFNIVKKLPYKFSYRFKTEDNIERTLMIEDWELGELYWKCFNKYNDEQIACKKVKEKYFTNFLNKCDLYFFLGTTKKYHAMNAPNPFIIIGTFYPKKKNQLELF